MGMNPRLLRPRQTGGFTPRSISGLALWLDAADSSTLYTTDAGPVTAVSSPLDIAGCVGWWDASDASSITQSGGLVSQWNDKSGNGRHLSQATSANRPSCTTRTLNGRAVLEFDGSNDLLSLADGSGNPTYGIDIATSRAVTIIAVFASDVTNSIRDLLSLQRTGKNSNDTGVYVRRHTNLSGSVEFAAGAGNSTTNDQTDKNNVRGFANTSTDAMMVSFAVSASAGVYAAHMNGAGQSLTLRFGTLPATGFLQEGTGGHTLDIGASRNFGNSLSTSVWDGIVAEVVMFNAALSAADRARIERYLAAKWGISGVHTQATATNDPVGAWLDKSGNGRHATQATGVSRPIVGSRNSRTAVAFDGTNDFLLTNTPSLPQPTTYFAVWREDRVNSYAYLVDSTNATTTTRQGILYGAGGAGRLGMFSGSSVVENTTPNTTVAIQKLTSCTFNGVNSSFRFNGATIVSGDAGTIGLSGITIGSRFNQSTTPNSFLAGNVCELMVYSTAVSADNRQRIEAYLASKWGIALAPQVSNADAQDWINRVYGNGGTVSATTASAVNQFCVDIENAGIRDRFYRVNLFCGNSDGSLAAVRTPLFRGPSLAGTQFGNATDTSLNFVQGDYAETGASGGLQGSTGGTARYLNTGLAPSVLPSVATGHLSIWRAAGTEGGSFTRILIGTRGAVAYELQERSSGQFGFWGSYTAASNAVANAAGHRLVSRTGATALSLYSNGSSVGTESTSTTPTSLTTPWWVFESNNNGSGTGSFFNGILRAYSIGESMTAGQAASFYAALNTFMAALSRT